MYRPLILDPGGLGALAGPCRDSLRAAFVLGASRDVGPGRLCLGAGGARPPGEVAFRRDLSWRVSRSELGESRPGERSYVDALVILLPPTDRTADEYDPDVRKLRDDAAERLP